MSGVFLSYSRPNRDLALQVITALRALGVDVWWDEDMPGVDWQEELERQIHTLAAVIVLWTPASVNSKNVRDEARLSQHTEKLINILAGVKEPPFPFDRVNGLPIDGWNGVDKHNGWTRLIKTVDDHLARAGDAKAGAITDAFAEREKTIRASQRTIAAAQTAHQTAQGEDEAATQAAAEAGKTLNAAQDQLRQVVEMRGSVVLMRAAQADLDAAIAAQEAADQARKAAGAALSKAARALTRAKVDFDNLFDEPPVVIPPPIEPELEPEPVPPPAPQPVPIPEPIPPSPRPTPIPPPPKPQGKGLVGAIVSGIGVIILLVLFTLVRGYFTHRDDKSMIDNKTAADAAAAMDTVRARAASAPPVGQALADYDKATLSVMHSAMKAQNYAEALALAQPLATQGDAEAENALGQMYLHGQGVTQSDSRARDWFSKAAAQHNADAQQSLDAMGGAKP